MSLARKIKQKFTYKDYLTWDDGKRWEIIDGEVYNMTPAPTVFHQDVVTKLAHSLINQLEGKRCIPFVSPIDVVLSEENVVQPDVIVVCDKKKILASHIHGAPDLVIEILSPSTNLKDRREKKDIYEKFGVKEYLLIDPEEKYAERYILQKSRFGVSEIFGPKDTISIRCLKGVKISLKNILKS